MHKTQKKTCTNDKCSNRVKLLVRVVSTGAGAFMSKVYSGFILQKIDDSWTNCQKIMSQLTKGLINIRHILFPETAHWISYIPIIIWENKTRMKILWYVLFRTLRPTRNGRHFEDDILKFSKAFSWIKIVIFYSNFTEICFQCSN